MGLQAVVIGVVVRCAAQPRGYCPFGVPIDGYLLLLGNLRGKEFPFFRKF
jgi:hypothetical protein